MFFSESELLIKKLKSYFPSLEKNEKAVRSAITKLLKIHPESFSSNLKRIRESRSINQIALANYLGISQTSYSSWETGAHVPRLTKLEEICTQLDIDVGELFSEASKESIKVLPLFRSYDLKSVKSDYFFNYKIQHSEKSFQDFFNSAYQFVFFNIDDSMVGPDRVIPKNSLVYCSTDEIMNTDLSKIIPMVDGKVVLLSIASGPAILREIKYDGTYLRLKAWNSEIDEKICLLSEKQPMPKGKEMAATYLNHPLVVSMLEFFGVAKKIVMEID